MAVIEEKMATGGKRISGKKPHGAAPTNVVDLVEVLRRSLEETSNQRAKGKRSSKTHTRRKKVA